MFHSSAVPVGLPVGVGLAFLLFIVMKMLGIPAAEVAAAAKFVGGVANIVAGGTKNLMLLDPASLVMVRPLSFMLTLGLIAAFAG
ncbi:MAG: hypothetical protein KGQ52_09045 [Alphaproteobacteria bacterium]|nr:hypothetical protein [Alphaproteobacteria bacterium]